MGVADQPFARFGLLDRHRLADQRLADENQLAAPFDLAVRPHPADRGLVRIIGRAQGTRIGALGGAIERSRGGEIQRLVRTVMVVDGAEGVEAPLLLGRRGRRRAGGFRFQGAVQALMAAVLLRLARIDPFRLDPELDPPHRKLRQPACAHRGEGRPIVRADRKRQAELAERRVERCPHMRPVGPRHRLAAQEIAAHRVADRQRIAARFVAGRKPALEVGAPHGVGRVDGLERRRKRRTAPPAPPRLGQPFLTQPVADRARSRRRRVRETLAELPAQLLGAPGGIAFAQRQQRRDQRLVAGPPMAARRPAALAQSFRAFRPIAPQPFVAGLPADPELGADLAHHRLVVARRDDKSHSLIHRTGLAPWHRRGPPRRAKDLSTIYPVQSVSDLTGSNKGGCLSLICGRGGSIRARDRRACRRSPC